MDGHGERRKKYNLRRIRELDIQIFISAESIGLLSHRNQPFNNCIGQSYQIPKRMDSADNVAHGLRKLPNPNIESMSADVLYHFALGTDSHDLRAMFSDVKFVCVGGSPRRMERFAQYLVRELNYTIPTGQDLVNIAKATDRYALYKVGPVLAASHGMGVPSVSIMMHEIIKLLHHAGCYDVTFFRIGTSGGLGMEPGTVVVTEEAVDSLMRPQQQLAILGKLISRPAVLDRQLAEEIVNCKSQDDDFQVVLGKTMCTNDFYEGQGRLDGAFCEYSLDEKMNFLRRIHDQGVRNVEMESVCFASMCHHAGIKGAVVCVTLLDRLLGDQITTPHDVMEKWGQRPAMMVVRLIKKRLGIC